MKIIRVLIATVATILCNAPNLANAQSEPYVEWIAVAVSRSGDVYQTLNQLDEESSKHAIKVLCELAEVGACKSISVPMTWDVLVFKCSRGPGDQDSFVGGSGQKFARRRVINLANEAGYESNQCQDIYQY